jgi:F-type H+-transporting ATPase subunit delta
MRQTGAAARRFAQALLEVADVRPNDPAAIRNALAQVRAALGEHPEAHAFLTHPRVPAEAKERLVTALVNGGSGDEPVARLLSLLCARGRLDLLPAIEKAFVAQWNARRGVVEAEVVSSAPLAGEQMEALRVALAAATRMTVDLAASTEPDLLGGLMVKIQGRTLDGTVRGRLRTLKDHLRRAAAAR